MSHFVVSLWAGEPSFPSVFPFSFSHAFLVTRGRFLGHICQNTHCDSKSWAVDTEYNFRATRECWGPMGLALKLGSHDPAGSNSLNYT